MRFNKISDKITTQLSGTVLGESKPVQREGEEMQ